MKNLHILLVILVLLVGCWPKGSEFTYNPYNGIKYSIKIDSVKKMDKHKSYFVYATLTVLNESEKSYIINIGDIKSSIGSTESIETWHDSIASNLPTDELLKHGESKYKIYFVFPEATNTDDVNSFKVLKYGLNQNQINEGKLD